MPNPTNEPIGVFPDDEALIRTFSSRFRPRRMQAPFRGGRTMFRGGDMAPPGSGPESRFWENMVSELLVRLGARIPMDSFATSRIYRPDRSWGGWNQ